MKILILGAGEVGGTLAESLAIEKNDITVVDTNGDRLKALGDRLDIRTVQGPASLPHILRKAGAADTDLLIAVTNSDEINMVACQVAHTLFRIPTKISRIRSRSYMTHEKLFRPEDGFPIDTMIAPEQLVTNSLIRLLEHPGTLQVLDFANGKVQLVGVKAIHGGPLVGHEIQDLRKHMPNIDTRVAAIYRQGGAISPQAETIIENKDEVFFIAAKDHIKPVMSELRKLDTNYKRIVIAGGGNIGERLAQSVEKQFSVKLIEHNSGRAQHLSETLDKTVVMNGSSTDKDLLLEANIDSADVFLALTNDDEANIMSSLLAKRLGARKVITLITNPNYVDLVQGGEIDIALSPQQITIGGLLTHVRKGDMTNVHSLRRGAAEAVEIVAHGDTRTSRVVGKKLGEIKLPEGVTIGAIVRSDDVLIAHKHIVVETGDHIIFFLVNKKHIREVEKLFEVGFGFF